MSSAHGKVRKQQQLTARAHRMRLAPSEPERVLWQALRCCQLGVQFRQQVVLHGYIVDFFAPAVRLVVEVDGAQHTRQRGADKRRDRARSRRRG
jgi:very-short-patch-repair endonuclease